MISCGDGARRHNNVVYQSLPFPDGRIASGGEILQHENIPDINGMLVFSGEPTPNPGPLIEFDVITVGRKMSLVNNSRHAFAYEWSFGDSWNTDEGTNPVHIYENPGRYTVTLKGTGFCGEAVTVSKEVSVSGIGSIHPKKGGNRGYVTMTLTGLGFTDQTQVKLVKAGQEILGTTSYVSEETDELQVYFDLTGKELGEWRLDVRNGGLRLEAKETFEIENVIAPEIHAEFVGRNHGDNRYSL